LLLERAPMAPLNAIEHLVGMQAQAPLSPYVGLWSRLRTFDPAELAALIERREAVRIALMRSTIHLVSANDCIALKAVLAPVIERSYRSGWGKRFDGVDEVAVVAAAHELMRERPHTFAELGEALAPRWPGVERQAFGMAARTHLTLVQVPPRGIWGKGGPAAHAPAEIWLGRALGTDPDPAQMIVRYLAAFGPASVADVQAWSGLTRLRPALERLRAKLVTFEDETGVELFDVPGAPRPDARTPAPVRIVPEYDNILLSHADRRRVIADADRERIFTRPCLLVDGFAAGDVSVARGRRTALMTVGRFGAISKRAEAAVRAEGKRLLAFVAAGTSAIEVRIVDWEPAANRPARVAT
jgi:hypothetical protein